MSSEICIVNRIEVFQLEKSKILAVICAFNNQAFIDVRYVQFDFA